MHSWTFQSCWSPLFVSAESFCMLHSFSCLALGLKRWICTVVVPDMMLSSCKCKTSTKVVVLHFKQVCWRLGETLTKEDPCEVYLLRGLLKRCEAFLVCETINKESEQLKMETAGGFWKLCKPDQQLSSGWMDNGWWVNKVVEWEKREAHQQLRGTEKGQKVDCIIKTDWLLSPHRDQQKQLGSYEPEVIVTNPT